LWVLVGLAKLTPVATGLLAHLHSSSLFALWVAVVAVATRFRALRVLLVVVRVGTARDFWLLLQSRETPEPHIPAATLVVVVVVRVARPLVLLAVLVFLHQSVVLHYFMLVVAVGIIIRELAVLEARVSAGQAEPNSLPAEMVSQTLVAVVGVAVNPQVPLALAETVVRVLWFSLCQQGQAFPSPAV
jgi:hypothetical protein